MIRYIGKSTTGLRRPNQHRLPSAQKAGTRRDRWIQSLRHIGLDYQVVVLEIHDTKEGLPDRERWWIAYGRLSNWPLTNHTLGGDGTVGYRHREETKKLIAQIAKSKGKKLSPEHIERIRAASTNRVKSPEERAKLSKASTGRKKSAEELEKMSNATKALMTPERRKLIGEQHKGLHHTEEVKGQISNSLKGRAFSEEHRANLSRAGKGRVFSSETIVKMSAAQKRRYAK